MKKNTPTSFGIGADLLLFLKFPLEERACRMGGRVDADVISAIAEARFSCNDIYCPGRLGQWGLKPAERSGATSVARARRARQASANRRWQAGPWHGRAQHSTARQSLARECGAGRGRAGPGGPDKTGQGVAALGFAGSAPICHPSIKLKHRVTGAASIHC